MTRDRLSIFGEVRRLLSHSVVYGLGNYSMRALGFFLIPVYTRYLVPAEYGILALANMVSNLLFIVLNMGQSSAFFRSYYDFDDQKGRESVITTSLVLTFASCIPLAACLLWFSAPLSRLVFGSPAYTGLFALVCLTTVSRVLLRIPFAILRAEEKSTRYALLSVSRGLLGIVLALVLVVGFRRGVYGIVWSQFASQFLFVLPLLPPVVWGVQWHFSRPTARKLLSFGIPLVFGGFATFVLNLSNRYFLKHFSTLDELGLYSLGYNFGEILWLLVTAVHLAYPPFILSNRKSPDFPGLYQRLMTYYFGGICFLALGLSVVAADVIRLMAAPSYREAYRVIPLIALAQVFHGFSYFAPVGLLFRRRPIYRTFSLFVAAGLNVLLNYLWIPTYGMMGAAAGLALAFIVQFAIVATISQRIHPLPFEYGRLLTIGVVTGGLYALSMWMPGQDILWLSLSAKLVLIAFYPLTLVVLGFFRPDERKSAGELLSRVRARLGPAPGRL